MSFEAALAPLGRPVMMSATADLTPRPTPRRSAARKAGVPVKRARRLAACAIPAAAPDPTEAKVAADVLAALAAFGLED